VAYFLKERCGTTSELERCCTPSCDWQYKTTAYDMKMCWRKQPNELIKAWLIVCANLLDVNVMSKLTINKFLTLTKACSIKHKVINHKGLPYIICFGPPVPPPPPKFALSFVLPRSYICGLLFQVAFHDSNNIQLFQHASCVSISSLIW
jgi:hypothetical protein